jgi:uncharacterized protein with NRDE domain
MCLIVFDWRPAATQGPLFTLAANRDEFLHRTAEPMHWWQNAPALLAGRDLTGGGTWLGMTRDGRFAALTNYRAPQSTRPDAPTRGTLVSNWLTREAGATPLEYLNEIAQNGDMYNGFNLLVGDWRRRELAWYCNRSPQPPTRLAEGTHGISNAVLDTPWPKLVSKRAALANALAGNPLAPLDQLIELMRDTRVARDDELPATGVTLEFERALSAPFIEMPDYGTRGTTALRVCVLAEGSDRDQRERLTVQTAERSDDNGSHIIKRPGGYERSFEFDIEA